MSAIDTAAPSRYLSRSELTELLHGRGIEIHFVSIAEALSLYDAARREFGGDDHRVRDLAALVDALRAPMLLALKGVTEPHVLAKALERAVRDRQPFVCGSHATAVKLEAYLRRINGAMGWIELAAEYEG